MKTIAILGAVSALAIAAAAPVRADGPTGKAVITHEALWMMKRVGAPAVSPDGKWVVFSVTEPSYEQDKASNALWLVPADGSAAPRRITGGKTGGNGVAWSPDSRSIAFGAKREGDDAEQIYVLDLSGGGEARRITSISTGAANPKWRPDGGAILFESYVYPGAADDEANKKVAAERKARKYNVRIYTHYPVRYWNEWLDDRQPTILVQSLEPGSKAKDILSGTALAKTDGFGGQMNDGGRAELHPVWSPDGREIVFTATAERWNAPFGHVGRQLFRMDASGGEPRPVTPVKGGYGSAEFSPDGKALYFEFSAQDDEIYNLGRLNKVAWPAGGEATLVTKDFDKELVRYQFTPDSRTIYLIAAEAQKNNLYAVPAEGGAPHLVIEPKSGGYSGLVIPEKAAKTELIANWSSSVSPAEVVRIDPVAKSHTNLTSIDVAAASAIDWAPPQAFDFTNSRGQKLHNLIYLPPAFDPKKKYPLIVFIHGGAASHNEDQISLRWNYHLLTAAGYVMVMTDYVGSTGYGEKFAQAIKLDPLKGPGEDIDQAVDEALKRYPFIDGTRMCAAGASYGGHLANWIEATTTRYRCIVSHAGEVDLTTQWGESDGDYEREVTNGGPSWEGNPIWREQSPITYAKNWKTPMLLSIGERDFRVPIGNTLENWATLQRMKVPSKLLVWPDAWHWILKPEDSRKFYQEVGAWFGKYLKEEPGSQK
jgi:dipeptidyl aminopeptidase/acylaminoacyl peptidase